MTRRQQLSCFGRAPCVALKVRWGFPLCWFYRVTHLKLFKIKSSPPRELAVGVKLTGGRIKGFCFSLKPSEWILLCFTGGSCHFESQRDDANSCLSVWNNPVKKKKKNPDKKKKHGCLTVLAASSALRAVTVLESCENCDAKCAVWAAAARRSFLKFAPFFSPFVSLSDCESVRRISLNVF